MVEALLDALEPLLLARLQRVERGAPAGFVLALQLVGLLHRIHRAPCRHLQHDCLACLAQPYAHFVRAAPLQAVQREVVLGDRARRRLARLVRLRTVRLRAPHRPPRLPLGAYRVLDRRHDAVAQRCAARLHVAGVRVERSNQRVPRVMRCHVLQAAPHRPLLAGRRLLGKGRAAATGCQLLIVLEQLAQPECVVLLQLNQLSRHLEHVCVVWDRRSRAGHLKAVGHHLAPGLGRVGLNLVVRGE